MAFEYTNKNDVSLPLAVFLMYDKYKYDERPNVISATGLIKPLRQTILVKQNPTEAKTVDISELVASRMGNAIHKGCETAWTDPDTIKKALKLFGMSAKGIDSLKVNPPFLKDDETAVYVEQRVEKEVPGVRDSSGAPFIISGQYDLVLDGTLNDFKSTSVWSYIYESNVDSYIKQGSIYKWLSPDKITSDYVNISYIFTDWSAVRAREKKDYPQFKAITRKYSLWSTEETENWIKNRVEQLINLWDTPQEGLPECTEEELWATETKYKHYKDSNSTRATNGGTHTSMDDALKFQAQKGGGIIKTIPGEVKHCRYCPIQPICTQSQKYIDDGRLML
tara:strand:+ start:2222 stop:3229 length:1008 start_codon:yes stop_codon:yes gene_type:complete